MKKLSDSDLRNFVNQNLSTQIPEGVYRAMSNMIYDSNFSYTRDYLTPEYGNNKQCTKRICRRFYKSVTKLNDKRFFRLYT